MGKSVASAAIGARWKPRPRPRPSYLMLDPAGVEVEVVRDFVHEADEAPEGVDLVLHHEQDRGE